MDTLVLATVPLNGETRGFPLNLDLFNIPATTNFPPLSQDAWASTAPFVSIPGDQTVRPLFLADRKLVAGVVDPITGQPLIREEDLELPVGRAMFRMIRTYGGNADGSLGTKNKVVDGQGDRLAIAKYWDWAGTGWMMSDNPILLFESQYIQHEPSLPRRCYLILDAHHSIPFTQDIQSGNYVAPAWFDAVMRTDGQWQYSATTSSGDWLPGCVPTQVTIRLYGEAVTYTFAISRENVPTGEQCAADAHARPIITADSDGTMRVELPPPDGGSGLGTPYAAYLQRIEDRFGNRAEFEHVPFRKYSALASTDSGCEACGQTCGETGQLNAVKLFRAGNTGTPDWTLVYVHRSFRLWAPDLRGLPPPCPVDYQSDPPPQGSVPNGESSFTYAPAPNLVSAADQESGSFLQNAVHAVYVYKNADVSLSARPSTSTTTRTSRRRGRARAIRATTGIRRSRRCCTC
jgi:hypothetical protein